MQKWNYILFFILIITSCSDADDTTEQTLAVYASGNNIETGAVIACAASDKDTGAILTFFYPEAGATNIRFYETKNVQVDHENYANYNQVLINSEPFFNGHLGKFTQSTSNEKWVIITFELDGEVKISNPIRIKHLTKPTVWTEDVTINKATSKMPIFSWTPNAVGDNAIYFQVISDTQNNLLSGTYTYQSSFQYYNTNNVVLNVTTKTPPDLIVGNTYNFTLMDVSIDNWVNLVITKSFSAQ
ncbi:hypothetical protein [Jejuia pallidilutea]|uniref:Lipoprotein n=1 Tax=Jejuia pallidilutea TaxID=504487 RepID=A0A090W0B0_9FLAO|nr:hypothetical protein [Jejuia pallidilutea]GAL66845.1 hypothetical protein JCM19301_1389 [Jejuia pallidilutea]GAL70366.1 hypothetical protein JCM19302_3488 [Jejuia pallidilutea]GAL90446.1 hypothetical protein JCM19538_211 [Jejuia pallidilutea]